MKGIFLSNVLTFETNYSFRMLPLFPTLSLTLVTLLREPTQDRNLHLQA